METSRQTLLIYEIREEFFDTIEAGKSRIENYREEKLFDSDYPTNGVKFSLSNNWGWTEKSESKTTVTNDAADELEQNMMKSVSSKEPINGLRLNIQCVNPFGTSLPLPREFFDQLATRSTRLKKTTLLSPANVSPPVTTVSIHQTQRKNGNLPGWRSALTTVDVFSGENSGRKVQNVVGTAGLAITLGKRIDPKVNQRRKVKIVGWSNDQFRLQVSR
ncbi:MAG: terminase small subunit [Gemmatales bacterium]